MRGFAQIYANIEMILAWIISQNQKTLEVV